MALSPRKRRRPIRESWCVGWVVSLREQTHLSALVANDEKSYFSGGGKRQPRRYRCIHRLLGSLRSNDATQRERGLKSEFAFFQSLSQLFLPTYFVKYRWTLLKLNSWEPYPNSEREINFRRCLFTSSIKREIKIFHVVVVQKRQRNVEKSVMHVQSCCFASFWRSRCRRVVGS